VFVRVGSYAHTCLLPTLTTRLITCTIIRLGVNACIVMYADDILLLAPSVHSLQILVSACESLLGQLDFAINVRKSVCIRIGPRCQFSCSPIWLSGGSELQLVDNVRYQQQELHVLVTVSLFMDLTITNKYQSPIINDINILCCVCFYFVALDVSPGFHFLLCVCYVNPAYGCQIEINCVAVIFRCSM